MAAYDGVTFQIAWVVADEWIIPNGMIILALVCTGRMRLFDKAVSYRCRRRLVLI